MAETLTVVIENIESTGGHIMLRILAGEPEFDGDVPAITSIKQRALIGDNTFTIANLPMADYGVQVMHDKNSNGKLDSNFVGMPTSYKSFGQSLLSSVRQITVARRLPWQKNLIRISPSSISICPG